jgi:hypothetical protein
MKSPTRRHSSLEVVDKIFSGARHERISDDADFSDALTRPTTPMQERIHANKFRKPVPWIIPERRTDSSTGNANWTKSFEW